MSAASVSPLPKRPVRLVRTRLRHVAPSTIARWLEVQDQTVLNWIKRRQLPAVNISSGKRPQYLVFRKDLEEFLLSRGMTAARARELLG